MLHGSLLLFNSAHFGKTRSLVEKRRQTMQLIGCADRVNLYTAIVLIAHPAVHAQLVRVVLHEGAKADTLDTPRYHPSACLG